MQVTHSNQCRQTTTTSEDLLGERAIKQQQPAHKQGVHLCMFEGVNWRTRGSVCEKEGGRERKRELVWKWNWVANKVKYHPHHPVSGQLNHQESGKIPSPPSMNSSQNHISMTSPWQTQYFENILPQYPGDCEWRSNESQLTRPLSVKELHHQERLKSTRPSHPLAFYCCY